MRIRAAGCTARPSRARSGSPDQTGAAEELQFDVITELWFEDEATFRGTVKYLATSIMPDEVVEDEKRLFDRARTRMATVVECESTLTP